MKLPEEFAPTGPKLSRFVIRPPPPVKPRLFEDEARFAVRLALLAGGTELAAWAWITRAHSLAPLVLAALIALRLLRPFWGWTGTRLPRPLVAFTLIAVALLAQGAAIFTLGGLAFAAAVAAGLPAVGDLAATTVADSVTVERRAAAYAWLDMGQGLGIALGIALGAAAPRLVPVGAAAALFLAGLGIPDLHDRGTPRSSWLLRSFAEVARTPLASQLALLAAGIGAACSAALASPRCRPRPLPWARSFTRRGPDPGFSLPPLSPEWPWPRASRNAPAMPCSSRAGSSSWRSWPSRCTPTVAASSPWRSWVLLPRRSPPRSPAGQARCTVRSRPAWSGWRSPSGLLRVRSSGVGEKWC